jgi:hypothetical protein
LVYSLFWPKLSDTKEIFVAHFFLLFVFNQVYVSQVYVLIKMSVISMYHKTFRACFNLNSMENGLREMHGIPSSWIECFENALGGKLKVKNKCEVRTQLTIYFKCSCGAKHTVKLRKGKLKNNTFQPVIKKRVDLEWKIVLKGSCNCG